VHGGLTLVSKRIDLYRDTWAREQLHRALRPLSEGSTMPRLVAGLVGKTNGDLDRACDIAETLRRHASMGGRLPPDRATCVELKIREDLKGLFFASRAGDPRFWTDAVQAVQIYRAFCRQDQERGLEFYLDGRRLRYRS
jgi:hypothetical protein